MKRIIIIIITLTIILTGCSSANKGAYNTSENIKDNNTKPILLEDIKDNNTNPILLENIDTTKSQFEKGYYDYKGSIDNNMPIQMSIYQQDKDIVGTYFYEKQQKEIKLQGKAGEKNIVLYEYDEKGKNTGVFKGEMKTVDKIEGTWISADSKKSYPFKLALKSIISGAEYGKRYMLAVNAKSDQEVEDFVNKIQSYILSDNKEQLAQQVAYPINVKVNGEITKIQNKDDFIKNYNQIISHDFKEAIGNAFTKYLFVNWQGIMFGEGSFNIWINEVVPTGSNSKLMITALNN